MTSDRLRGSLSSVAIKPPVRVATTAAITLAGLQTIDGVSLAAGDRVLVKNQSDPLQNGIYLAALANWRRAPDFDGGGDAVRGTQLCVNEGSTQENHRFKVASADPVLIGGSALVFERISDGPPGPQGLQGPQGIQGPQGPQGASGAGTGDILGPASVTANTVTLWDGTTGDLLKQGPALGTLASLNSVGLAEIGNAAKVFDIPFNAGFDGDFAGEDLAAKPYGTLVLSRDVTIEGEVGYLETPATGAAAIVDVEKNGASVYSGKPQFAAGSSSLSAGSLSATTASAGDRLLFKVIQIGSTTKGQKLRFGLKCRLR